MQKVLAAAGFGSRRDCEELITTGRVEVDGEILSELGVRVDPQQQRVLVDGERIRLPGKVYYAVHKPKGIVSTDRDPQGRPRVIDLLPETRERLFLVGRLDRNSEGLILLTNDGELALRLTHPRYGVEKLYRVQVAGQPPREVLNQLTEGVHLAEGKAQCKSVRAKEKQGNSTWLEITLAEGTNRVIRRMLAKLGHKVLTLRRISVGPLRLGDLQSGEFRRLHPDEVHALQEVAAGIPTAEVKQQARKHKKRRPSADPPPSGGGRPRRPPGKKAARSGGPAPGRPSGKKKSTRRRSG